MTEYTPTTDEVRHMFATAPLGGAQPALPVPALVREFDRWLDQVKADAWDSAVVSMVYADGTPVEIVANRNPYRTEQVDERG